MNSRPVISSLHPGGEGEYYTMKIRPRVDEVMKKQSQTTMTDEWEEEKDHFKHSQQHVTN